MEADSPLNDIRIGQITQKWGEHNHLYVHYETSLASTNDLAKTKVFAEDLAQEPLCLFLTDHQTAGRGRGRNTWLNAAKPGACLLSSWSYIANTKPQPTLTCLVGLAVYRALSTTWPFLDWNLKAPNDIYLGVKKAAGILVETVLEGEDARVIVGLGLNVLSIPESVSTAGCILDCLPSGVPLLGQDWTAFLDRLLYEMTDAVFHAADPLTPSDRHSLLKALNMHPLLKEKYADIDAQGSLRSVSGNVTLWSEL